MESTKATLGGAPKGNKNAAKAKIWSDAIRKAVVQKQNIDKLAMALVEKALEGDISALKELGDRIEGKVAQSVEQSTEHSGTVHFTWQQ